MKKIKPLRIFILTIFILLSVSLVQAQEGNNFEEKTDQPNRGDNIVKLLDLTPEQIQQIQMIRREIQPRLRIARIRQRDAREKLDEAIYADAFDEVAVQLYLKDFLQAQVEVNKLRFQNEMAFRNVLTPQQLVTFRNIRNNMKKNRIRRQNNRNRLRRQQLKRQNRQNRQRPINRRRP